MNAAKRELREEFKLSLDTFDQHFCYGPHKTLRTVTVGATPVLVGYLSAHDLDSLAMLNDPRERYGLRTIDVLAIAVIVLNIFVWL